MRARPFGTRVALYRRMGKPTDDVDFRLTFEEHEQLEKWEQLESGPVPPRFWGALNDKEQAELEEYRRSARRRGRREW